MSRLALSKNRFYHTPRSSFHSNHRTRRKLSTIQIRIVIRGIFRNIIALTSGDGKHFFEKLLESCRYLQESKISCNYVLNLISRRCSRESSDTSRGRIDKRDRRSYTRRSSYESTRIDVLAVARIEWKLQVTGSVSPITLINGILGGNLGGTETGTYDCRTARNYYLPTFAIDFRLTILGRSYAIARL